MTKVPLLLFLFHYRYPYSLSRLMPDYLEYFIANIRIIPTKAFVLSDFLHPAGGTTPTLSGSNYHHEKKEEPEAGGREWR